MQTDRTESNSGGHSAPGRTIIVDDTPSIARAIRSFLENEMGRTVSGVAHSGEQAIEMARELQPALALIDLFMPGLSGLEVVKRLRAVSPATRLIVVTCLGEEIREICLQAGADGFVAKNRLQEKLPGEIGRIFGWQE